MSSHIWRHALLAAMLCTAACDSPSTPASRTDSTTSCTSAEQDAVALALLMARTRWEEQGILDYTMRYSVLCYCSFSHPQPLTVRVEDGRVAWIRDAEGRPLSRDEIAARSYLTVPGIFHHLEGMLGWSGRPPARFSACFDDDLGYPRSYGVDPDPDTADDEFGYSIEITYYD